MYPQKCLRTKYLYMIFALTLLLSLIASPILNFQGVSAAGLPSVAPAVALPDLAQADGVETSLLCMASIQPADIMVFSLQAIIGQLSLTSGPGMTSTYSYNLQGKRAGQTVTVYAQADGVSHLTWSMPG